MPLNKNFPFQVNFARCWGNTKDIRGYQETNLYLI